MQRPRVVLPQPLSPTRPRVSPWRNVKADIIDGLDIADRLAPEAPDDGEVHLQIVDTSSWTSRALLACVLPRLRAHGHSPP